MSVTDSPHVGAVQHKIYLICFDTFLTVFFSVSQALPLFRDQGQAVMIFGSLQRWTPLAV